ncbi:MAG: tRNA (adenosine(37)-N6)-dimethylallyltransferase MiaA [Muribaculaceae bacterium]|nr:tRNA (adenosine(37)-N6)-dimethylallyltransferase MiaA [Muribaculaceae bacterium]
MSHPPTLIMISGPTASGKSALAVEVAERLGTEIISADSRQIYRGIPIVTAAPTPDERARVSHHLVEVLPLDSYYSAAQFEADALGIAKRLLAERGVAVACGGSMLYVDALCKGIDALPTVPDNIRFSLMREHGQKGDEWLLSELARLDPDYYSKVDRKNIKRVFHAVEIIRASGKTYTELRTGKETPRDFRIIKVHLEAERPILFDRINRRVDAMIAAGLEEEARSVYGLRHLNSLNTVGLKEMFAWFDGTMDRTTAIERIKKNTRVYAKKQITWRKADTTWHRLNITHVTAEDILGLL